jgi:hypothetical protein
MFITKPKNENEKLFIDIVNKKYGEKEFLTQEEIDDLFQIANALLK